MPRRQDLDDVAQSALAVPGIQSVAIFARRAGASGLDLVGSAGIGGPPLDNLVAAVQNPAHPVARALDDLGPSFDVRPMNPGGPALRSHLPLGGLGVLAVAHEPSLTPEARSTTLSPRSRTRSIQ
ncbi:MAG TPA: hypothetical protein VKR30_09410 [Candidatus Limnocylindrales bacterium]|nr:hypothetical protein [Candidatus Limnocylindrales bacterium]